MFTLSCYIAEVFPILEHCCCVPCFIIWLRDSQSWNIPDLYPVSLQYWDVPYLETFPTFTLSYYIIHLFLVLELWWRITCSFLNSGAVPRIKTLWKFTQSFYFAELFQILEQCWRIPCHATLLSLSQTQNFADVDPDLLHCWIVPILKTLQMFTLSRYNAEPFPILKQGCCIPCLFLNLKFSLSWNIAELYPVSIHCSDVPILETLLTKLCHIRLLSLPYLITLLKHTLTRYIDGLFPILIFFWCIACPIKLLSNSQS